MIRSAIVNTQTFRIALNISGDADAVRVAIILPGRLDSKDYHHMVALTELFGSRGFLAVCPDAPGTWESGGGLSLYTLSNYKKAVFELHEHFASKPVIFAGHSFGGFMSLACAVACPQAEACINIMGASHFNRGSGYSAKNNDWQTNGYLVETRDDPKIPSASHAFNLPWGFQEARIGIDVRAELAELYIPKLFVYGIDDTTIYPKDVKEGFDAAAAPKELCAFESAHDYRHSAEKVAAMSGIVEQFLIKQKILRDA